MSATSHVSRYVRPIHTIVLTRILDAAREEVRVSEIDMVEHEVVGETTNIIKPLALAMGGGNQNMKLLSKEQSIQHK